LKLSLYLAIWGGLIVAMAILFGDDHLALKRLLLPAVAMATVGTILRVVYTRKNRNSNTQYLGQTKPITHKNSKNNKQ